MARLVPAAFFACLVVPLAGSAASAADLDYYGPVERPLSYERKVIEERRVVEERPIIEEHRVVVERPIAVERPLVVERPVERVYVERPVVYPRPYYRAYGRPFLYAHRYPRYVGYRRFGFGPRPFGYGY